MNLTEIQNNIDIVLKPFDNKGLNARQQHAKDTLIAAHIAIKKLSEVIENKDEQLAINYRETAAQGIKLKAMKSKYYKTEDENKDLNNQVKDLKDQIFQLKQNLEL